MKRKPEMFRTFKTSIFATVPMKDAPPEPVTRIIGEHLVINLACCDLHIPKERFDPETKTINPSGVENILNAESFLTFHYAKRSRDMNTLYDFITVDCSGGNDRSPLDAMIDILVTGDKDFDEVVVEKPEIVNVSELCERFMDIK